MNRYKLMICATVAAFALSALPASAQRPGGGGEGGGGGERPSGGPSGGSAGGGSGPAGPSGGGGGGGGGSVGSSGGGGGSSVGSPSSDSGGFRGPSRPTAAPRNPNAPERRGGGDRAVPRGAGASGGGDSRGSARVSSAGADASSPDRVTEPSERAVPAYSRPREGRTATGTAVDRQYPIVRGGRNDVYYYPYYSNYYSRYYWPGYGFGLGFYGYDPFWFDPYYDPYYTGYYGGSGGYSYQGPSAYRESGALRLKIKPREAKVYVDGYFVGEVDSFDGVFQKLGLEAGGHQVEIRADGYETAQFEVLITPGETVTYRGDLKRIQ